jgi:hypothetical protein
MVDFVDTCPEISIAAVEEPLPPVAEPVLITPEPPATPEPVAPEEDTTGNQGLFASSSKILIQDIFFLLY